MDSHLRDRAVDQAYRDHAPEVYRVAYGVLRDPDEALDATHDAFARAWERWEQYDSQRPLRAWLHGIVVHLALDRVRRRRVRALAVPVLGGRVVAAMAGGGDPANDIVRRKVVDDALATLRPPARAALILRHYYGYDYAQIGQFLGMTSGTVGSTLSRAHASLRSRLQPDGDDGATPASAPGSPARPSRPGPPVIDRPEPPEVLP
jgi:RNA polymerase sigma-70 factor (ECF subfamily)